MTVFIRSTVLLAGLLSAVLPAAAQGPLTYGTGNGPVTGTPVDALPTPFSQGGSCVRMCPNDTTPCDPISYKLADRRCNFNQNGPGPIYGRGDFN